MATPSVMVRMISRGNPDARAAANLFCVIAKACPAWDVAIHTNRLSVALARNEVAMEARRARADFLIMLDDDVVPTDGVVNLPDHDLPIVGGLVPFWKEGETFWNAFQWEAERLVPIASWTPGELLPVYAVGGAILCIRKDIITLEKAYPLFSFITLPTGVMAERGGEDIAFCRKMHAWNIPIHLDPDVQGRHHCAIDLHQTLLKQQNKAAHADPDSDRRQLAHTHADGPSALGNGSPDEDPGCGIETGLTSPRLAVVSRR